MTMLLGRAMELGALARHIAGLATLWGAGGAGKTTLARADAERVRASGTEVVWVDLASARSRDDVVSAFALTLGLDAAARDDVLRAACATAAAFVADNVEQVTPDGRAFLVALAETRRLLVTSRDALGAPGETAIEVAPLDEASAVALYMRLTGSKDDGTVRAIVRRLDALPLAIELAAARAPLLGNVELLARLDRKLDVLKDKERTARHATLRGAIAWSWDLLDETDRAALVSCAQFDTPFDAALAEAAIGDDALDALESLRKRALLHVDAEHRLFLLEAVRDFAREHPDDLTSRRSRWADAVLARVEPLALAVRRGEAIAPELMRRRVDLRRIAGMPSLADGLRARALLALAALLTLTGPLDFASEIDLARAPVALVIAKGVALRAAGRLDEAEACAARALECEADDADALRLAGAVARSRGATERAVAWLERALAAYRTAGEDAFAGITLGEIGAATQDVDRLSEGIALLVATKSLRAEGLLRSHLAVVTHRRGDPRGALPLHDAALAIHRRVGNRRLEGAELLHRGFVQHEIAEVDAARASFEEARHVLALAGARGLEALASVFLARLEVDAGDPALARIALAEAARISPAGWPRLLATRHLVSGHLALATGDRAGAATAYDLALEASRDVEVGFEALTPAYRALALEEPPPAAPVFMNPHLASAFALLTRASAAAPARALASSSEVRRALAFTSTKRTLVVTATTVVLPDGRTIDLARRKNLRFIVHALAQSAGRAVGADALIEAGWPGEKMRADAATKRLHTAVWTLRKLGFEGILRLSDEGYELDPSLAVDFERL